MQDETVSSRFVAGREEVKYPDFTLTKPLPRQPPTVSTAILGSSKSRLSLVQKRLTSRRAISLLTTPWSKPLIMPAAFPTLLFRYENKIRSSLLHMWFIHKNHRDKPGTRTSLSSSALAVCIRRLCPCSGPNTIFVQIM